MLDQDTSAKNRSDLDSVSLQSENLSEYSNSRAVLNTSECSQIDPSEGKEDLIDLQAILHARIPDILHSTI